MITIASRQKDFYGRVRLMQPAEMGPSGPPIHARLPVHADIKLLILLSRLRQLFGANHAACIFHVRGYQRHYYY